MNRRWAVRTLAAASAGSFLRNWPVSARPSAAQPAASQDQPKDFTLRSDVVLVLLDVSVKDHQGRFVPGLAKDNFRVFEDGKLQKITVFDPEDRPVTVGLLLDESFSMTPKRQDVVTAAETLIEESNRQDEIFVLHFNQRVTPGLPRDVPFSGDLQQLHAALGRATPGGKTKLNDALIEGLRHLRLGRRDKKTLVLVSDGGDTASEHSRRETLDMVQRSVATIYTIGLYDPDDPDRDPGFLRQLARMSGGEAYLPSSPKDMAPLCQRIAKEIRTRYSIGYAPEFHAGANALRHIQVHVKAPDHGRLMVRARSAYRYDEVQSGQ